MALFNVYYYFLPKCDSRITVRRAESSLFQWGSNLKPSDTFE